MPLIHVRTSALLNDEIKDRCSKSLSHVCSDEFGKPEQVVMVVLENAWVCMAGISGPGAFVDVRSIGNLNPEKNQSLSDKICTALHEALDLPPDRIYLNFTDVPRSDWGWNRNTFG